MCQKSQKCHEDKRDKNYEVKKKMTVNFQMLTSKRINDKIDINETDCMLMEMEINTGQWI